MNKSSDNTCFYKHKQNSIQNIVTIYSDPGYIYILDHPQIFSL